MIELGNAKAIIRMLFSGNYLNYRKAKEEGLTF